MADLQELVVRIRADAAQLESGMRTAANTVQSGANQMGNALSGLQRQFLALLPVVSLVAFEEFTRHSISAGVEMVHMSEKTGLTVEQLSSLDLVVRQNGASLQDLTNGLKFLNRNISEAAAGNQTLSDKFKQLGLDVKQLNNLSTYDQFLKVMDAISQFGKASDRTNLGMGLMGRGFMTLGPLAAQGAEGIKKVADQAERLGLVMSTEKANKLKDFNDKWQMFVVLCERFAQSGFVAAYDSFAKIYTTMVGFDSRIPLEQLTGLDQIVVRVTDREEALKRAQAAFKNETDPSRFSELSKNIEKISKELDDAKTKALSLSEFGQIDTPGKPKKTLGTNPGTGTPGAAPRDPRVAQYIQDLQDEAAALQQSSREYTISQALVKARGDAIKDAQDGLRTNKQLTDEETASIRDNAAALYDAKQAQQEMQRASDQLAGTLTDLIVNFDNLGTSITSMLQNIAREIITSQITRPLSQSIISSLGPGLFSGGGGLFGSIGNLFHFAGGGDPPVGVPSLVGERGPELFVPKTAGTVIPNHMLGGGGSTFTQIIQISPGVPELIRSELIRAAPIIAEHAKAGVFQEIERGGAAARAVGRRV